MCLENSERRNLKKRKINCNNSVKNAALAGFCEGFSLASSISKSRPLKVIF